MNKQLLRTLKREARLTHLAGGDLEEEWEQSGVDALGKKLCPLFSLAARQRLGGGPATRWGWSGCGWGGQGCGQDSANLTDQGRHLKGEKKERGTGAKAFLALFQAACNVRFVDFCITRGGVEYRS